MNTFHRHAATRMISIILSILLSSPYAFAGEIGRVTYAEGRVDVQRPGSQVTMPLQRNDPISVGDAIRTKSNSKAEITFADKTVVRLAQNSKIDIKDYQLDQDSRRKTATVGLERGKVRTIIAKMPHAADFIIDTPNAEGKVTGSDIFAFYQAGNSGMLVADGKLSIHNTVRPETSVLVPAGSSVLVPLEETPKGPRPYLELEKKLHEQDTNVPVTMLKTGEETVLKGAIAKMSGAVKVTRKGEATAHAATLNEILEEGDRIETGEDGMVEILIENGNAINLKPNSNLTIIRLLMDPKTGEYENSFESTMGKIKARIEGLKGKSSFTVKSPTAISGARGTIMYLEINPTSVRAAFEGGTGFIKNVISGLEQSVAEGHNSYADSSGNVTNPAPTPEGERADSGQGWDPGSGVEGYSSPDGTVGVYLSSSDTGAVGIVGAPETPETGGTEPFNDVPFEGGGTTTTVVEESLTSSGNFYGETEHYGSHTGTLDGVIGLTSSFWNGQTATLFSAGHLFVDSEEFDEPFIWYSTDSGDDETKNNFYSNDPATNNHMTYDGGAFFGIADGIGGGSIVGHPVMEALSRILYIDPQGNAGVAGGDLVGVYSLEEGAYLFLGTLQGTQMASAEDVGVEPADLLDSLYLTEGEGRLAGSFTTGGSITADERFQTLSIVNDESGVPQDWGIYAEEFRGSFSDPETASTSWTAEIGGYDAFGARLDRESEEFSDDYDGYWTARVTQGTWKDFRLEAALDGDFITPTKMGTLNGGILGTYVYDDGTEGGTWQGVGEGVWEGAPLTFSGEWGEEESSLYYNSSGYRTLCGEENGLIGSTVEGWWNAESFPVLAMGNYWLGNDSEGNPIDRGIWNSPVQSYNAPKEDNTTLDGGAFWGFTAGLWDNEQLDGAMAALYVSPDGTRAGVVRGGALSGNYFPGIGNNNHERLEYGMWQVGGELSPTEYISEGEFDPTRLYNGEGGYIRSSEIRGNRGFYGAFHNEEEAWAGEIRGYQYASTSYSIPEESGRDTWGIYNITLGNGNSFDNPNPEAYTEWSAVTGGEDEHNSYWLMNFDGTWEDNEIRAAVNGRYLHYEAFGTIAGDFFGVNNGGTNTWIGTSVGVWSEEPLATSGQFEGASYYYDYWDDELCDEGYINGIVGTTTSPYDASATLHIMGDAYPYGCPTFWGEVDGSHAGGDDVFYGWMGGQLGSVGETSFSQGPYGGIVALYIDGSMNAGILQGEFDQGSYYGSLGMWEATGTITGTQYFTYDPDDPESFLSFENVDYGTLDGYLAGQFNGEGEGGVLYTEYPLSDIGSSETLSFRNALHAESWGIWKTELGGYYEGETSDDWTAYMGGTQASDEGEKGINYWLATIHGDEWSDGFLSGTVTGKVMTDSSLGTIDGSVYGSYDPYDEYEGTWEAVGLGKWTMELLATTGRFYGNHFYYPGGESRLYQDGETQGIVGTLDSPYGNTTTTLHLMGEAYPDGHPTFVGTVEGSYDANDGNPFYGWMGGTAAVLSLDEGEEHSAECNVRSGLRALYIDESGNAGILSAIIGGDYKDYRGSYNDYINMWSATGEITGTQYASRYDPSLFDTYLRSHSNDGYLDGAFIDGEGEQTGRIYNTYSISEMGGTCDILSFQDEHWGISKATVGGYYEGSVPDSWVIHMGGAEPPSEGGYGASFWLSTAQGGEWSEHYLSGIASGRFLSDRALGSSGGEVCGSYDTYGEGTWEAVGLGVWSEVPLSFASNYIDTTARREGGDEETGIFHAVFSEGHNPVELQKDGDIQGLMGGISTLWPENPEDGSHAVFMGTYGTEGSSPYSIWAAKTWSHDYERDTDTTYNGGAYYGLVGGALQDVRIADNPMAGLAEFLYVDPSGNLGILSGKLDGTSYPGLGMFELDGDLARVTHVCGVEIFSDGFEIAPEDLTSAIDEDTSFEGFAGTLFGQDTAVVGFYEGILIGITTDPEEDSHLGWGVLGLGIAGYYSETETAPIPASWKSSLTGLSHSYSESDERTYIDGCLLGIMDTASWKDHAIEGTMKGFYLGLHQDGDFSGAVFEGDVLGNYNDGMWQALMAGAGIETGDRYSDPDDAIEYLSGITGIPVIKDGYSSPMVLSGTFEDGQVMGTMDMSSYVIPRSALDGFDSLLGIWAAKLNGTYEGIIPESVEFGYSGLTYDNEVIDGSILGVMDIDAHLDGRYVGELNGEAWGIRLNLHGDGTMGGDIFMGGVAGGYVDVDEDGVGTFAAASGGEWVEVEQLLDTATMETLNQSILDLAEQANIPITVYSSALGMTGGAGPISAVDMSINFYGLSQAALDGIWASLIQGTYASLPTDSWSVTVNNPSGDSATLSGSTPWTDNSWQAGVTGTVTDTTNNRTFNFNGAATGTYTDPSQEGSGNFSGAGTGTWTQNQNPT